MPARSAALPCVDGAYPTTMVTRRLLPAQRCCGAASLMVQQVADPLLQSRMGQQEGVVPDRRARQLPAGGRDVLGDLAHELRREEAVGVDRDDQGPGTHAPQGRGGALTVAAH